VLAQPASMRLLLFTLGALACACPSTGEQRPPVDGPTEGALDFAEKQGALEYLKVMAVKKQALRPQISLPGKIGFDEDHSSILKSSAMIDKLQQRMKDELNQLPSP